MMIWLVSIQNLVSLFNEGLMMIVKLNIVYEREILLHHRFGSLHVGSVLYLINVVKV